MITLENFTELKLSPIDVSFWTTLPEMNKTNIGQDETGWWVSFDTEEGDYLSAEPCYGPFDTLETAEVWATWAVMTVGMDA